MQAIIIGGGISGLICAYLLKRAGLQVRLLEQSNRFGGVIETISQDGFQFELGPQSFLSNESVLEVVRTLGMESELLRADGKAPRFILLNGKLVQAPMGPGQLFSSPLFSAGTKFRLISEPFRKTFPPSGDESLASFVRRKFGNDLLENLAGPFVSGIHAGDPEKLSVRSAFPFLREWEEKYGSVLKGAMKSRPPKGTPRPTLSSFRNGVGEFVQALRDALGNDASSGATVEYVTMVKSGSAAAFEVTLQHNGAAETLTAPVVIVATDTVAAGKLLSPLSDTIAALLQRIEYAAVAVVGCGYRREQITNSVDGFGFLVPRKEKLRVLGTVYCSSLFPGRAPQGMVNLTSFVGGATDQQVMTTPEPELAAQAEREVANVLGISGPPMTRVIRRWPRALPQYNLGHAEVVAGLQAELSKLPGLFLAGNYLSGASIGYCTEHATKTVAAVVSYLKSNLEK